MSGLAIVLGLVCVAACLAVVWREWKVRVLRTVLQETLAQLVEANKKRFTAEAATATLQAAAVEEIRLRHAVEGQLAEEKRLRMADAETAAANAREIADEANEQMASRDREIDAHKAELARMAQELSQVKNTLAHVQPPQDRPPMKAKSGAQLRAEVERRNRAAEAAQKDEVPQETADV